MNNLVKRWRNWSGSFSERFSYFTFHYIFFAKSPWPRAFLPLLVQKQAYLSQFERKEASSSNHYRHEKQRENQSKLFRQTRVLINWFCFEFFLYCMTFMCSTRVLIDWDTSPLSLSLLILLKRELKQKKVKSNSKEELECNKKVQRLKFEKEIGKKSILRKSIQLYFSTRGDHWSFIERNFY